MTRWGWLALVLGLSVAGCGVGEIVGPEPGDLSGLRRPTSPNTALAGPAGFVPTPDITTRRYAVDPPRLYATAQAVVMARPRTTRLSQDAGRMRADHVERSMLFRFPDVVVLQVLAAGQQESELVLYSRSVVGHSDLGVNRRRLVAILADIDAALAATP